MNIIRITNIFNFKLAVNKVKRVVLVGIATGIILSSYWLIFHILPYSAIRPHRITKHDLFRMFGDSLVKPISKNHHIDSFSISVDSQIVINGWLIPSSDTICKGTVILLHGVGSCKEAMIPMADFFSQNGYHSVIFDARAHGESGGLNCTFGYYEKHDVSILIDSLFAKKMVEQPIILFGNSFGAAVAIQASEIEPRINKVVAVSSFATLKETIHDYFASLIHFRLDFIADIALGESEKIASFKIDEISPEKSASRLSIPALIIHGSADEKITYKYSECIYKAINHPRKQLLLVEGATHDNVSEVGGEAFQKAILAFINDEH